MVDELQDVGDDRFSSASHNEFTFFTKLHYISFNSSR